MMPIAAGSQRLSHTRSKIINAYNQSRSFMPLQNNTTMAHTMRTQIGIIIGLVEIIRLHESAIDDQSKDDLRRIRAAADKMLHLVAEAEQQDISTPSG